MKRHRSIRSRAGWTRLSWPGDKCGAHWRHDQSGYEVKHCGHPTALYPYTIHDPAFPLDIVMSHNGMGWAALEVALTVAEKLSWGRLLHTTDGVTGTNCRIVPGITCEGADAL